MVSWQAGGATLEALDRAMRDAPLVERFVPDLFAEQAVRTPDVPALVADDLTLGYGELDARANRVANYLRVRGVGAEVCVALCLDRSAAYVVAALAVLKAGGAYLPLDPAAPSERLGFMLRDSAAPIVLTARRFAAQLPAGPWRLVLLDVDWGQIAQWEDSAPDIASSADQLACVIYTSGSNGQPKGVEVTHGALLNLIRWHHDAFAVTPADRATQLASVASDAATWEVWPYLTRGASIHVPPDDARADPARLRDWLIAQRITIGFAPTPLAELLLALPWPPRTPLRALLTGGDTLRSYPPADLPFDLVNNYGLAENAVVATSGVVRHVARPEHPPTIGRPIPNVRAHILDEWLQPVADGTPGELCIGGASLARGYRNRPELTAERFVGDPFSAEPGARLYRSGDLVRRLPNGEIALLGRVDEQVKGRSQPIEPGEVAATLAGHPAVRSGIVVAREGRSGEQHPLAYEVGRAALPAPDAADAVGDSLYVAPRSTLEEAVAAILCELLNLDQISVVDNFVLLGGHSSLGQQVLARLGDTFGVEVPLRALSDTPTVAGLAAEVETLLLARFGTMTEEEIARLLG